MKARELIVKIRAKNDQLAKVARDSNKYLGQIGGEASKASSVTGRAMRSLGDAVHTAGKRIVQAGIVTTLGLIAKAIHGGWGRLTGIENARASLEGLGHEAEEVDSIMANALASVKGTAFGMADAAEVAGTAVGAGIKPGKELERVLGLVADAAVIGKTSMGEMGAIFNKVAARGSLTTEVLNQLQDRGIGALGILAEYLGKTQAEVADMVRNSEIDFETFAAAMEAKMGGAAKNAGKTATGALANFSAALGRIGANVMQGAFSKLPTMLGWVTDKLGWVEERAVGVGEALGTKAAGGAQWLASKASELWTSMGGMDTVSAAWDRFTGYVDLARAKWDEFAPKVAAEIGPMVERVVTLATAARDFVIAFAPVAGTLAKAAAAVGVGAWVVFTGLLDRLAPILSKVAAYLRDNEGATRTLAAVVVSAVGAVKAYQVTMAAVSLATRGWAAATGIAKGVLAATKAVVAGGKWIGFVAQYTAVSTKALAVNTAAWVKNRAVMVGHKVAAGGRWVAGLAVQLGTKTKALTLSTIAWARDKAAMVGHKIATGAVIAATKAQTIAQRALNLVLRANPIGLIITGIMLLVGALVYAWKNNETFRRVVLRVWDAVKRAIDSVAKWFTGTALPWLSRGLTAVRSGFSRVGATASSVWESIKTAVRRGIDFVVSLFLNFTGPGLIIKHWDTIKRAFSGAWDWVRNTWSKSWSALKSVVTGPIDAAKTAISNLLGKDGLQRVFSNAVSALSRVWGGLKSAMAGPIDWVANNVVNPLIRSIKSLLTNVGLEKLANKLPFMSTGFTKAASAGLKFASGGVLPGHTPGVDVHQFYSPTGGRLALSGGEAILRPEFTRLVGGAKGIALLNKAAMAGKGALSGAMDAIAHFAGGGIVNFKGHRFTRVGASRLALAERLGGGGMQITQGGWRPTTSYSGTSHRGDAVDLAGSHRRFIVPLRSVGWPAWDRTGRGNWISHTHGVPLPGHGVAGGSAVWQAQDYLRGGDGLGSRDHHPRPKINLAGSSSLAGLSAAQMMTLAGGMSGTAQASYSIRPLVEKVAKPFLSKLGGQGGGVWGQFPAAIPKQVVEGVIKTGDAMLFDQGGFLPPGFTLAHNKTGRPEPILTGDQWDALLEGRGTEVHVYIDGRELKGIARDAARVEIRKTVGGGVR